MRGRAAQEQANLPPVRYPRRAETGVPGPAGVCAVQLELGGGQALQGVMARALPLLSLTNSYKLTLSYTPLLRLGVATKAVRQRAVRSDSQRNREAIRAATVNCLLADPRASMADIASAAGVTRVTLYGHFATRQTLVSDVFRTHLQQAEHALDSLDRNQSPTQLLATLSHSPWQVMADSDGLIAAAEAELGSDAVREAHTAILDRVETIIRDGIDCDEFRSSQPPSWLTECFFALMHGAANVARHERISELDVAAELETSVLALMDARSTHRHRKSGARSQPPSSQERAG